jgi:hypothetical protein
MSEEQIPERPGMWSDEPMEPSPAPEGASFSIDPNRVQSDNGNGMHDIPNAEVVNAKENAAMNMAVAAFMLAGAALSIAMYVYLTRKA